MRRNTTILLYDGRIEMVENIKIGDLLMGDDSMPREVRQIFNDRKKTYRVNDTSLYITDKHVLCFMYQDIPSLCMHKRDNVFRVHHCVSIINDLNLNIIKNDTDKSFSIKKLGSFEAKTQADDYYIKLNQEFSQTYLLFESNIIGYKKRPVVYHNKLYLYKIELNTISYFGDFVSGTNHRFLLGDFTVTHDVVVVW